MLWADVFLHSAVSEGFCNAVMEAQAMSLPVVCTDAGGLPENVEHEVSGFVVPRREPQPLAERLALLARNPALRQQMGQAGRRRVLASFRQEKQIADFDRFFREVLPEGMWPKKNHSQNISPARSYKTFATETQPPEDGQK